eukprot:CAMPEP_0170745036 /NCGR_PEP_ID=MMETSP0437-20130122/8090_1 /TAXON_ID=0 /ORGANISM="Sexangularia sp." /LENGTH=797 /DNA_ID=CAMNT_0011083751 /DNA_START=161 /DNA_END=2554 /DNA_ORIENTATION=-
MGSTALLVPAERWLEKGERDSTRTHHRHREGTAEPVAVDFVLLGSTANVSAVFGAVFLGQFDGLVGTKEEEHGCTVVKVGSSVGHACVGVGELGAVYALYTWIERALSVHPQRRWIDWLPGPLNSSIPRHGRYVPDHMVTFSSGVPAFERRLVFINDEDQLSLFFPDPMGQAVFSLDAWNDVYDTVLRMKANGVMVGTCAYVDERSYDLGVRRGVAVTTQHFAILGENTFRWPDSLPFSFPTSPELMADVWSRVVRYQATTRPLAGSSLYSLGYRAKNDYAFWKDFPPGMYNTSESRGALISRAVAAQLDLLQAIAGTDAPAFTYLWDEMVPLYAGGYLTYPKGVGIVHADNGLGFVYNESLVTADSAGVYYHVAMQNGHANQLTELVPPARLFEQLRRFVEKGATKLFVVNTSDMRAVPLGTACALQFAWNPTSALAAATPADAERDFISNWTAGAYNVSAGTAAHKAAVAYYLAYFNSIPYQTMSPRPLGEQHLSATARDLLDASLACALNNGSASCYPTADARSALYLVGNASSSLARLEAMAAELVALVPPARQQFATTHAVTQVATHRSGCAAVAAAANATLALAAGVDASTVVAFLESGVDALFDLFAAQRAAEPGGWAGWYGSEVLDGFQQLEGSFRNLSLVVSGAASSASDLPFGRFFHTGTGTWSPMFDYELESTTYWPLFYNSPYYTDSQVNYDCTDDASSTCTVTPLGFDYTGANVSVSLYTPGDSYVIKYIVESTGHGVPTELYAGPVAIASTNVTVSAVSLFANGTVAGPVSRIFIVKTDTVSK